MPNYGLVVTPQYNPMSYEQYIQPFKDYAQVYNATADQVDALEMEANQWERLADSDIDVPQYQQYKSYADDLRKYANEIATQGLSSKTRAGLSRMRQRYAKEIKPIEDAYNRREEEIKFQREARLKDPDVIFNRDASSTALGKYMSSMPELQNYSGRMLQAYSAEASKQLAKQVRENPRQWNTILGGQYFETVSTTGLTDAEILATIANSPIGSAALSAIGEQVLEMSGMNKWNEWSPELQARVNGYIENGYWQAIGETKFDNLSNKYYDFLLRQREKAGDIQAQMPRAVEEWVFSPNQKALLNEYGNYFREQKDVGGNTILNEITDTGVEKLGKHEVRTGAPANSPHIKPEGISLGNVKNDSKFYDAMFEAARVANPDIKTEEQFDALVKKASKSNSNVSERLEARKQLKGFYDNVSSPNDLTGSRRYRFDVNNSTGTNLKNKINVVISQSGVGLEEVDYDPISQTYKPTGKSVESLGENDKVIGTTYSLSGATVNVIDKDGKVKQYRLPVGIDVVTETNRDNQLSRARAIAERILTTPNLPEASRQLLLEQYRQAIQQANLYHSQLGFVNESKNQEYQTFEQ